MKILAVIPARGGSKGIKYKNIQHINNMPMIGHTIKASKQSKLITRTIVSTDDEEIATISKKYLAEVPFLRPEKLANDCAKSISVALHALNACSKKYNEEYDYFVLLQPTSPFRESTHIDCAIQLLIDDNDADSLISVKEVSNECNPHYIYKISNNNYCEPLIESKEILRRQELPKNYVRNGAIYIVKVQYLKEHESLISDKNLAYEMDDESSINIDTELDLLVARSVASLRESNKK